MSANLARLKKRAAELEQKKQFDKALDVYIQILEEGGKELADDDVPLFNRVGDMLMRKGNMSEALSYYERAVDVYAERGFLNNAIALCSKILRQSPGRTAVYYKLGRISARKGFKSDARKNFLEYADRMQKAGKSDEAFRALKEFASLYPDQDDVRLILAELLSKENRKGEALEQLQSLYDKLEAEGRKAEARATVDRMKAIDPNVEPRVTGTQAVQQSADLVFLDLTDEAPTRAPTPTPRRATPRVSAPPPIAAPIPALDGLTLTFVPDDSEPLPPVSRPAGFEQTTVDEPVQAERIEEGTDAEAPELIELEPVMQGEDNPGVIEPIEGLEATALEPEPAVEPVPDESGLEVLEEPVADGLAAVEDEPAADDVEAIELAPAMEGEEDVGAVELLEEAPVPGEAGDEAAEASEQPLDIGMFGDPEPEEVPPSTEKIALGDDAAPDEEAVPVPVVDDDLPVIELADAPAEDEEAGAEAATEVAGDDLPLEEPEPALAALEDGVTPDEGEADREPAPLSESEFAVLALPDVPRPTPVRAHDLALPGYLPGTPQFVRAISATPTSTAAGEDARNAAAEEADLMADLVEREALHRTQPPREAWAPRSATPVEPPAIEDDLVDDDGPGDFFGAADPSPDEVSDEFEPASQADDFLSMPPSFGEVDAPRESAFPPLEGLDDSPGGQPADGAEWASPLAEGEPDAPDEEHVSSGTARSPRSTLSIGSAEDHLRRRLELEPENWQLRRMLGEAMLDTGNREGGLYELELAMVGFELDEDIDRAVEVVDEIIGLLPGSVRHHQKRVEYAVRARDRRRLIHAYLELADALFRTGTADKAVSVYSRVLELDGSNDRAEFALATLAPEQLIRIRGGSVRPERWSDELAAITDPAILVTPPPRTERAVPDEAASATVEAAPDEADLADAEPAESEPDDTQLAAQPEVPSSGDLAAVREAPDDAGDVVVTESAEAIDVVDAVEAVEDGARDMDVPVDEASSEQAEASGVEEAAAGASDAATEPEPVEEPSAAWPNVPDESDAATWVDQAEAADQEPEPVLAAQPEPEAVPEPGSSLESVDEPKPGEPITADDDPSTGDWDSLIDTAPDSLAAEEPSIEPAPVEDRRPQPEPALSRLERARRLTPAVVSESDFVDLGEWLRTTEPVRSTRMMVEDPKPTGDEQADFEELLRRFKRGVAENVEAEDYEAHYDLGVAYKEMGLVDEAIAQFQKSLRGTSHRVRSYEALGQCFVEKEQYPIAAALLQRATELPGTDDQQLVGVLYLLGFATEHLGRPADALPYYLRVFAVDIEFRDIGERVAALGNPTK